MFPKLSNRKGSLIGSSTGRLTRSGKGEIAVGLGARQKSEVRACGGAFAVSKKRAYEHKQRKEEHIPGEAIMLPRSWALRAQKRSGKARSTVAEKHPSSTEKMQSDFKRYPIAIQNRARSISLCWPYQKNGDHKQVFALCEGAHSFVLQRKSAV